MTASPGVHVLEQTDGPIRTIRFARPEKKNALTVAMYARVVELFAAAAADPAIRVVVLTGEGSAFTAGNDLLDFVQAPPFDEASPVVKFLLALVEFRKPLVVAVNGVAIGVGTTMLLHADVVIAAASARFQLPFVNLGLVPEAGSSLLLPRIAGNARASELLLFGEPFDANAAREAGIVTEVVPDAELAARVKARAEALAAKPPQALLASKELLRGPRRAEVLEAMMREAAVFRDRLKSAELQEAVSAFLEKRAPDFSKK
jgi:enoyl-CoA hydratase/carnithine racemase